MIRPLNLAQPHTAVFGRDTARCSTPRNLPPGSDVPASRSPADFIDPFNNVVRDLTKSGGAVASDLLHNSELAGA